MIHYKTFIILVSVILVFVFSSYIPLNIKIQIYTVGQNAKDFILFVMPFFISMVTLSGILKMRKNSFKFLLLLIGMICLSNFIATWLAYFIGNSVSEGVSSFKFDSTQFSPVWNIGFIQLFSPRTALLIGLFFGIFFILFFESKCEKLISYIEKISSFLLTKLIGPLVPIFVISLIIIMAHQSILLDMFIQCSNILLWYGIASILYLLFLYLFVARAKFSAIINMLPAGFTALISMSSVIALPMIIDASKKNIEKDSFEYSKSAVPSLINFHLLGDCFMIPLISFAIMLGFDVSFPSPFVYFIFSLQFVISKFSVLAIPSGGIIVMIPILASYLMFDDSMISIITLMYALLDPMITLVNVLANGAFIIFFSKANYKMMSRNSK